MSIIKRRTSSGFTISEFLVAMTIGFISLAGAAALSVYTARSFAAMGNYMALHGDYRGRELLPRAIWNKTGN